MWQCAFMLLLFEPNKLITALFNQKRGTCLFHDSASSCIYVQIKEEPLSKQGGCGLMMDM